MLFRTHAIFSLIIASLTVGIFTNINKYLFIFLIFLGGMLPDVDKGSSKISNIVKITKGLESITKHRGIFHSIFIALLIPGVIFFYINKSAGVALFLGYMGHLVIDSISFSGINFIHPFKKLQVSGFIETGSIMEHVLTVVLAIVLLTRIKMLLF